jgi:excisionase family DNA binding protein
MNLLTTKELAKQLGVTMGTIYRMAHSGIIPTIRVGTGRNLRFDFEEVKTALAQRSSQPSPTRRKATVDPLFTLHKYAIETGIKDLAQNHDHYLYGVPIKSMVSSSKR